MLSLVPEVHRGSGLMKAQWGSSKPHRVPARLLVVNVDQRRKACHVESLAEHQIRLAVHFPYVNLRFMRGWEGGRVRLHLSRGTADMKWLFSNAACSRGSKPYARRDSSTRCKCSTNYGM